MAKRKKRSEKVLRRGKSKTRSVAKTAKRRKPKCSVCGKSGHNQRTCGKVGGKLL